VREVYYGEALRIVLASDAEPVFGELLWQGHRSRHETSKPANNSVSNHGESCPTGITGANSCHSLREAICPYREFGGGRSSDCDRERMSGNAAQTHVARYVMLSKS
jgi:hypothetical protein